MNTNKPKKFGLLQTNLASELGKKDIKAIDAKLEPCTFERAAEIAMMDWKKAKPILDAMTQEELMSFQNYASRMSLKKVAWQNFRVSMDTYARIKSKARDLELTPTELLDFLLDQV